MAQLIETPNGKVEFNVIGTGIPVLFIHGGHSNCEEELFLKGYDPAVFQLIVPSRPGYGKTPLEGNESPKRTAELFVQLLDQLELESVTVVGISAGGLTAIELAAHFPERVRKLLLISAISKKWLTPASPMYVKGKRIFRPAVEKYSWAVFRFFYSLFPRLMAKVMFKELSTVRPPVIAKADIQELKNMIGLQRSHTGFVNDLDQDLSGNIIHKISCPTLIQHSLNDGSVKLLHPMHAGEGIRNSRVISYNNNWGHLLWLGAESEEPISDAVEFIRQQATVPAFVQGAQQQRMSAV